MRAAFLLRSALACVSALAVARTAHGFAFSGAIWPDGSIEMHLQLGPPATPLSDGAADWAAVAESALNEWNAQLARVKFTAVRNSTAAIAQGNRLNNVMFRPNYYGLAFDENTLAVTLEGSSTSTGAPNDNDVVFNSNLQWDSYRGTLRANVYDFRRVALHEFGHVLGLDHPDAPDASYYPGTRTGQNVAAVMRSRISSTIETLRADDIAGVKTLYDAPVTSGSALTRTIEAGSGSLTLTVPTTGSGPFSYFYYFRPSGSNIVEEFTFANNASYTIGSVQPADSGMFIVTATNTVTREFFSATTTLTVTPAIGSADTTLGNLSTRGVVGSGNSVLIAGFVIGGSTPKPVLVRAVGPALADFGVGGALLAPRLTIVNGAGQNVAQNEGWETGGNGAAITAAATRLGAFQFRRASLDSALLATLPPGNYSAVVSGVNDTAGVALVEVYDADPDAAAARTHRLVNIATRGQVSGGENALIAGLIVTGPGPRTYLIRAVGPTLLGAPFSVTNALRDPVLQIYQGDRLLRENDDIDSPNTALTTLRDAAKQVGAFALREQRIRQTSTNPGSGLDAAMLVTLPPGAYTAKVTGFEGATGVSLIEIYEMP